MKHTPAEVTGKETRACTDYRGAEDITPKTREWDSLGYEFGSILVAEMEKVLILVLSCFMKSKDGLPVVILEVKFGIYTTLTSVDT